MEASVNVLTTTGNQLTKSHKKEVTECETKDQNEKLESEKNSTSKAVGAISPVREEGKEKDGVLDHPLAVKESDVEDANQSPPDKVWYMKSWQLVNPKLWILKNVLIKGRVALDQIQIFSCFWR